MLHQNMIEYVIYLITLKRYVGDPHVLVRKSLIVDGNATKKCVKVNQKCVRGNHYTLLQKYSFGNVLIE